jgi:hypothetical protein
MTYNRRQRGTAQPPLGAGLWPLSAALPKGPALWAGIFTELCMLGDVVWWRWPDLRILAMPRVRFQNRAGREHESVLIINPPARATNSEAVAQIIATRFAPCAIIRPIYSHSRKTLVSRKRKTQIFRNC